MKIVKIGNYIINLAEAVCHLEQGENGEPLLVINTPSSTPVFEGDEALKYWQILINEKVVKDFSPPVSMVSSTPLTWVEVARQEYKTDLSEERCAFLEKWLDENFKVHEKLSKTVLKQFYTEELKYLHLSIASRVWKEIEKNFPIMENICDRFSVSRRGNYQIKILFLCETSYERVFEYSNEDDYFHLFVRAGDWIKQFNEEAEIEKKKRKEFERLEKENERIALIDALSQ